MTTDGTIWLAAGLRTPFTKVDGGLAKRNAIGLGVPVVRAMAAQVAAGSRIDFAIWGTVIPNLGYANIARETWLDSGLDPTVPTSTTVMQCCTGMAAAFEAAGIIGRGVGDLALAGGTESMTHVQAGLTQPLSDTIRRLMRAHDLKSRAAILRKLELHDLRLHVPAIKNRATGKSMGEHCEEMAKTWEIGRAEQDEVTLASHVGAVTGRERGFFDDLIVPVDGVTKDAFPRADTTLEKLSRLSPVFDVTSGNGTITAGNASPLTDGAAGVWVASTAGLGRLPSSIQRVRLVDFDHGAVDIHQEGLLMAPVYLIPRMLKRNGLTFADVALYELHEAFAAQILCHLKALETPKFLAEKVGVTAALGKFPRERMNPNGGSVALGHPFAATGGRILSQAIKELAAMPSGSRAIVSICADGGLGTVALLEAA